jgi:hypothetical protein
MRLIIKLNSTQQRRRNFLYKNKIDVLGLDSIKSPKMLFTIHINQIRNPTLTKNDNLITNSLDQNIEKLLFSGCKKMSFLKYGKSATPFLSFANHPERPFKTKNFKTTTQNRTINTTEKLR